MLSGDSKCHFLMIFDFIHCREYAPGWFDEFFQKNKKGCHLLCVMTRRWNHTRRVKICFNLLSVCHQITFLVNDAQIQILVSFYDPTNSHTNFGQKIFTLRWRALVVGTRRFGIYLPLLLPNFFPIINCLFTKIIYYLFMLFVYY